MHIVIDGYNLIRQSPRFSALDSRDLQSGRDALVEALAEYKRIKKFAITVVFDGTGAAAGMVRRDRVKGIDLCFSRPGETADAVIKRMAASHREKLLVVTSDQEIAGYAAACGASVISAVQFDQRLLMAHLVEEGPVDDLSAGHAVTTKKKGPSRRLSKKQRRMQRKAGKL